MHRSLPALKTGAARKRRQCRVTWSLAMVLALLLTGCSSLPTAVERTPSHALTDTQATPLGRDIQPLLARHPGQSGFHPLSEGADAFAARLLLISSARKSIDAQYYIWHDDGTGSVLHEHILIAADRGVRVRLLLDDLDTAGKEQLLHLIDAHPNIEIRIFNPFANRSLRAGDFLTDTRRINRRMHNKTLTADNQATIFGGRNIGDEYFAAAKDVGFGDMDALAIGPIAGEISSQFDLYWNSEWAYPLAAFEPEVPVDTAAVAAFRKESAERLERSRQSRYAGIISDLGLDDNSSVANLEFTWSEWLLVYDQPSKVNAEKVSADTHLAPKLKAGMDRTREELIIVSPYFVPGENFTGYLVGLVDKGVKVRILTNSLQANDVSMVHAGYMRYRKDLVAGGVELYEFKAVGNTGPDDANKKKRIGASRASLHAKFFGFDQTYLFIGSFNLDPRSVALNTELGVYYRSPDQARYLSENLDANALKIAYRVELDKDGGLTWITLQDGQEIRVDKEPDTTAWKRFSTRFLSIFVPESQL